MFVQGAEHKQLIPVHPVINDRAGPDRRPTAFLSNKSIELMKMAYAMALLLKISKDVPMAKPNYSFEKRQRELAKKKKKEQKRQQKLKAKEEGAQEQQLTATDDEPVGCNR